MLLDRPVPTRVPAESGVRRAAERLRAGQSSADSQEEAQHQHQRSAAGRQRAQCNRRTLQPERRPVHPLMRAPILLLLLCLAVVSSGVTADNTEFAQATVRGSYNFPNLNGTWTFLKDPASTNVSINITITGLAAGTYGTHIHTYGDVTTGITASDPTVSTVATGVGVGAHFNPYGTIHNCYPNSTRHVGDIGNLEVTGPETQTFYLTRDLIDLGNGSVASIIGRGVILHSGEDHCASAQPAGNSGSPIAQGVIGIVNPAPRGLAGTNVAYQGLSTNPNSAIALFHATPASGLTITGTVQFGFDDDTQLVRVVVNVTGLPANSTHGFHVHEWGDDSGSDGTLAGGHYNPYSTVHALPPTLPRHVGDIGNIVSDLEGTATLDAEFDLLTLIPNATSVANIIGRGVVIHTLADDGGQPTGNAGGRLAVAVIGISNRAMPAAVVSYSSSSTGGDGGTGAASTTLVSIFSILVSIFFAIAARRW